MMTVLKKGFDFSGNKWVSNAEFIDLFNQIMCLHPGKRIHPEEILEHEFMASKMMRKAHAAANQVTQPNNNTDDQFYEGQQEEQLAPEAAHQQLSEQMSYQSRRSHQH